MTRPPVGWPLLPVPDENGRIGWPDVETSIRDFIRIVLETRRREQLLRPDFGVGLQDYAGRPDTTETRQEVLAAIHAGLTRWESRIEALNVEVTDAAQPGWLRVEIAFRIRRTGVHRRLGLNLSLETV